MNETGLTVRRSRSVSDAVVVADCSRLQLGVAHWAILVALQISNGLHYKPLHTITNNGIVVNPPQEALLMIKDNLFLLLLHILMFFSDLNA